jgi:hypothetical protein
VSPDGAKVFVTGYSVGPTNTDYATVGYDAVSGSQSWVARFNGPQDTLDYAYALGVSPEGSSVFVTGQTDGGDYGTIAYDASTGAGRWKARFGTRRGSDLANAFAVSPDGSTVFVTGAVMVRTGLAAFGTLAYASGIG